MVVDLFISPFLWSTDDALSFLSALLLAWFAGFEKLFAISNTRDTLVYGLCLRSSGIWVIDVYIQSLANCHRGITRHI